jgi:hypothetical protein
MADQEGPPAWEPPAVLVAHPSSRMIIDGLLMEGQLPTSVLDDISTAEDAIPVLLQLVSCMYADLQRQQQLVVSLRSQASLLTQFKDALQLQVQQQQLAEARDEQLQASLEQLQQALQQQSHSDLSSEVLAGVQQLLPVVRQLLASNSSGSPTSSVSLGAAFAPADAATTPPPTPSGEGQQQHVPPLTPVAVRSQQQHQQPSANAAPANSSGGSSGGDTQQQSQPVSNSSRGGDARAELQRLRDLLGSVPQLNSKMPVGQWASLVRTTLESAAAQALVARTQVSKQELAIHLRARVDRDLAQGCCT